MARSADRQNQNKTPLKTKVWLVGFYIRLSREDKRGRDESESITNQRLILTDFLEQQDDGDQYIFAGEYVDDGVSGTTDEERENFQLLLKDIEKGKVNCVIVKNLARSFRNNGDQSYYLGDWFPRNNVRFISLYQQPIDTYKDHRIVQNLAVPVQGVLNEEHARGTSESVRRTFDKKREKGLHIGSFTVYGYEKDPKNRNALIVDPEAAKQVKRIFSWYQEGKSKNAIVHLLNDYGILCPSAYKRKKGLKYQNPNADMGRGLWSVMTITGILKNQIYTGDMVQGRYRKKSYKIHVQEAVPEEEWFVVSNTHEPIIKREDFKQVQELLKRDTRTAPNQNNLYLFRGFLRCGDCGKAMTRSKVKNNVYYHCSTYKNQSKSACTKHTIRHMDLEQAVLDVIRQLISIGVCYREVIEEIDADPKKESRSDPLEGLIKSKEKELYRITHYKQSLYEDWKDCEITKRDYQQMKEDYERRSEAIQRILDHLQGKKEELDMLSEVENPALAAYRKSGNINELTRDIIIQLVDHIRIYENGSICVKLRFADEFHVIKEESDV